MKGFLSLEQRQKCIFEYEFSFPQLGGSVHGFTWTTEPRLTGSMQCLLKVATKLSAQGLLRFHCYMSPSNHS